MNGLGVRRRTPEEQQAYMQGFEAALNAIERELERTRYKTEAVERVRTALALMRETIAVLDGESSVDAR